MPAASSRWRAHRRSATRSAASAGSFLRIHFRQLAAQHLLLHRVPASCRSDRSATRRSRDRSPACRPSSPGCRSACRGRAPGSRPALLRAERLEHQHHHPRLHRLNQIERERRVLQLLLRRASAVSRDTTLLERPAVLIHPLGEQPEAARQRIGFREIDLLDERARCVERALVGRVQRIGVRVSACTDPARYITLLPDCTFQRKVRPRVWAAAPDARMKAIATAAEIRARKLWRFDMP